MLGKREAEQQIVIEFDTSAVIAEEEAAKSRKVQKLNESINKTVLNSTHDVTLQNRNATILFADDDKADDMFAVLDNQDELMQTHAPAKKSVKDKDAEMLFGTEDADEWND
jgi:prephenate dehydratase